MRHTGSGWGSVCHSKQTIQIASEAPQGSSLQSLNNSLSVSQHLLHLFLTFTSRAGLSHNSKYHISICYECICLHIGHLKRCFFFFFAKSSLLNRKFHYNFCKYFKLHLQDHIKINLNIRCMPHACSASCLTMSHDLTLFCLTALTSICGNCSSVCVSSVPSALL